MRKILIILAGMYFVLIPFIFTAEESEEKPNKENKTAFEEQLLSFENMEIMKFIKPDMCGECHSEIYKQWEASTHSKAFVDPIWRATTRLFYSEAKTMGQVLEMKLCVKCHVPLGFRSNILKYVNDNYDVLLALPSQGTFCNWCHNLNEAMHIGGAGYEAETDIGKIYSSTILGPRKDPRMVSPPKDPNLKMHSSEYSEFYTKSDFCGLCHDMSHLDNQLPIIQTFSEWEKSPYNTKDPATTVTCQDCHMRQRAGFPATGSTERPDNPGKAADNGPQREHVWTHYFAGGNSIIPKILGSDIHSNMAIERLTNSADLEIVKSDQYEIGKLSKIKIKVTNSGAGHYLPTGMTVIRQMWLDIKITDRKGTTILRSGAMNINGDLEENTIIYNTVLGDKNGNPIMNFALADRILYDYRIPPKGHVLETYSFIIPENAFPPLNVEATLKYRTASPGFVKKLMGNKSPLFPENMKSILGNNLTEIAIPVVDMESAIEKIEF